jgi:hypothetical protein
MLLLPLRSELLWSRTSSLLLETFFSCSYFYITGVPYRAKHTVGNSCPPFFCC